MRFFNAAVLAFIVSLGTAGAPATATTPSGGVPGFAPPPIALADSSALGVDSVAATATNGHRHLQIGALRISKRIHDWGCRGGQIPDRVWSWGCSGHNNLFLLGHGYGVFKPLHDAYRDGTLHAGMTLRLRNSSGKDATYTLSWYRLVTVDQLGIDMWGPGRTWAWEATDHKVVTLMTCYGAQSQYRLIVRFDIKR